MDGYTKQKYHEAIDRAVTKTTNGLIDDGKIDKNTIVGVNVEISFFFGMDYPLSIKTITKQFLSALT